jgi:hypothetical protein
MRAWAGSNGDAWISRRVSPARVERMVMFHGLSPLRPRRSSRGALLICVTTLVSTLALWLCAVAEAAPSASSSGSSFTDIASGVGAAIGAVIALLGGPSVYLGVKKSQAEIRKLELETAKLQSESGSIVPHPVLGQGSNQTYSVVIDGERNMVSITADPRLLGPLLLLLDFVTATIILTIAGYLLNFGGFSLFSPLLALVALALFTPIFREARRLKRILTPAIAEDAPERPDRHTHSV